jgi:phosphatidylglycerol---prolipoprotein diacylglyceryl transferase
MFPIVFRIGHFFLPSYGLLVALGFLAALWMVGRLSRRAGLDVDATLNLGIYTAIAAMLGAKVFMLALDFDYYSRNLREIFSFSTLLAGGVFYGGLIAGLLTAFLYLRRSRLPGLATADVFAPAIALGHAIGRVGCFAAGCCWGAPSNLPWAVTFTDPFAHERMGVPLGVRLQPTQLYEALAEAVICLILYRRFARPHRPGAIIGLYLILYPTARFLVEFVRSHDELNPHLGPLVAEQWVALGLIALGVYLIRGVGQTPAPAAARPPARARR